MPIEIDPRRTAVVVIDMQNDVVHADGVWGGPSGAAAHCAEQDAIAHIGQITAAARKAGSRVFFVHHLPSVGAADDADSKQNGGLWRDTRETGGLSSEWGRAPVEGCAPEAADTVLYKQRGNAFTSTGLDVKLRGLGVDKVILLGAWTNMAVESTARVGADIGYEMAIVSDATVSINAEWQNAALSYGVTVFAEIPTTAEVLSAFGA
jgi:ureidoacrylate peracid hydrolase